MKSIGAIAKKLRNRALFLTLAAVGCAGLAAYLSVVACPFFRVLSVMGAVGLSIAGAGAWHRFQMARLICGNPILDVTVAEISTPSGKIINHSARVILSGFGIWLGGKYYRFRYNGLRLSHAEIGCNSVTLAFENAHRTYSARFLHGLAGKEEIGCFAEQLRYETGVTPDILP